MTKFSRDTWAKLLPFDKKLFQKIIISTFIIGMLTHGFCYLNMMYSHDSLAAINQNTDFAWKISIGRFLQLINIYLRGPMVLSWVIGVLSLLWLAIAICFLVQLLGFTSSVAIYATVGLLATNTALTLTNASYIHEADSFMLALLFAVLAVYTFDKYRYGFLLSPLLLVACCGFYQAYLAAAVVLFMLVLLRDILQGAPSVAVLKKSAASVAVLLVGTALYYLVYKLTLLVFGLSAPDSNNSIEVATGALSFDWPVLLAQAYQEVADYFFSPFALNPAPTLVTNALLVALTVFLLVCFLCQRNVSWGGKGLFLLILAVLPLGLACVGFLSNGRLTDLMKYQYAFLHLLPILMLLHSKYEQSALRMAAFVLVLVVVFQNYTYANTAYLRKELAYQRTLSAVTRVIVEMEDVEGYQYAETPVAIVGNFSDDYSIPKLNEASGIGMYYNYSADRAASLRSYFKYVLAYDIDYLSDEEIAEIGLSDAVQAMPSYPDAGYCQIIDGVLVVKLADIT